MIINTGMRTDIPAFYTKWFTNRLKAGFVLVRNPYDPQRIARYRLTPDVVDLIGFCTKNPAPMLPHMDLLRPFGQYWFVTITPYGKEIEPRVPEKGRVLENFKKLSDIVGIDNIGWRYDPIFINDRYTVEYHLQAFENIAKTLAGYTCTAVISFIDLYEKTVRNFPEVQTVPNDQRITLGKAFIESGKEYGMTIKLCAEGKDLESFGADCSGCMTVKTYETALHRQLRIPAHTSARKECACYLGGDIGAYNTCGHLCRYCYANYDAGIVRSNIMRHDPESPLLIGHLLPDDRVYEAKQESWIDPQLSLI